MCTIKTWQRDSSDFRTRCTFCQGGPGEAFCSISGALNDQMGCVQCPPGKSQKTQGKHSQIRRSCGEIVRGVSDKGKTNVRWRPASVVCCCSACVLVLFSDGRSTVANAFEMMSLRLRWTSFLEQSSLSSVAPPEPRKTRTTSRVCWTTGPCQWTSRNHSTISH